MTIELTPAQARLIAQKQAEAERANEAIRNTMILAIMEADGEVNAPWILAKDGKSIAMVSNPASDGAAPNGD